MTLTERFIPAVQNISVNNAKPYAYTPNVTQRREQILTDGNQNTMVGILAQMSILANFGLISKVKQKINMFVKLMISLTTYWL